MKRLTHHNASPHLILLRPLMSFGINAGTAIGNGIRLIFNESSAERHIPSVEATKSLR
jgi:hypothetical protein